MDKKNINAEKQAKDVPEKSQPKPADRKKRLSDALRNNLKRRKEAKPGS